MMHLLNNIYNENCITFMKKIPDNSIDLIIAVPWDFPQTKKKLEKTKHPTQK